MYIVTDSQGNQSVLHTPDGKTCKLYKQDGSFVVSADLNSTSVARFAHQAIEIRKEYKQNDFLTIFEEVKLRQMMNPDTWKAYIVRYVAESPETLTAQLAAVRGQASLKSKKIVTYSELTSVLKRKNSTDSEKSGKAEHKADSK